MRRGIVLIIGILLIFLALFGLSKQISNALEAGLRLDKSSGELVRLQKENHKLKKKLEETAGIDFVESQARNKLNLSLPNETVVIIPEEEISRMLNKDKKPTEEKLPNWQGWLRLFTR